MPVSQHRKNTHTALLNTWVHTKSLAVHVFVNWTELYKQTVDVLVLFIPTELPNDSLLALNECELGLSYRISIWQTPDMSLLGLSYTKCPPTQTANCCQRHWESLFLTSADELQGNKMLSKGFKTLPHDSCQCSSRVVL